MMEYNESVLAKAKEYLKGNKPNEIYMYRGKMVVFFAQGLEHTYPDAIAAFDPRTGDEIDISIREMSDFWDVAEKIV